MSLRIRIVALIGLFLLVSVLLGVVFAGYEARQTLQAELGGALTGGRQTAKSAFEDLPRSDHVERDLRQLVAAFDGDRHLRAQLVDGSGRVVAASASAADLRPAPAWFAHMLGPPPSKVVLQVPVPAFQAWTLRLEPVAAPDVGAVWTEFSGVIVILGGFALAGLVFVYVAIGAALKPLDTLSAAFGRVGAGDYAGRIREQGPPELVALERAFNSMAERLFAMQAKNRALEIQLANIQDEERTDLARDLHDEIGPHLFAVKIDAQIIGGLIAPSPESEVSERLGAIQAAATHMQRLVRDMLARLRPARATELGLNPAIADLTTFWRARRPDVSLEVDLAPEQDIPETLRDTVYRVVQEGLSNAMRHGDAAKVEVSVAQDGEKELLVRVADDGVRRDPNPEGGYGLIGMRERVRASNGKLYIDEGAGGWTVTARLPLATETPVRGAA